ncbi:MAG: hypothetical protein H0V81_05700 [Solirubrobacterales bacterium]|nr:hypothetical protein [Solirubrobacterales bacterium]
MLQIILIILAAWVGLALLALPVVVLFGGVWRRADAETGRQHRERRARSTAATASIRYAPRRASQA